MAPLYDHCSAKMLICGKSVLVGYKICKICANNGYPYKMHIYSGKYASEIVLLGTRVVKNLLSVVCKPSLSRNIF